MIELDETLSMTTVACQGCGSRVGLTAKYGRYGYFVECDFCATETPLYSQCQCCGSEEARIIKRKEKYYNECRDCGIESLRFSERFQPVERRSYSNSHL
ncbi:hypothetical protein [Glaciecola sp. 1036]|uniref:hypothetical protein n=1 Tax=Alteromonadaceae TaxID=72275 RepID=UPI003D00E490